MFSLVIVMLRTALIKPLAGLVVSTAKSDLFGAWIECTKVSLIVCDVKNIIHKDFECSTRVRGGISNRTGTNSLLVLVPVWSELWEANQVR